MTPPLSDKHDSLNKHDAECLRRKVEMGWTYLCACDLTDAEIEKARAEREHAASFRAAPTEIR